MEIGGQQNTISQVFKLLRNWVIIYFSKWYIFLIILFLCGFVSFIFYNSTKPTYKGELTFVLSSETKSSGISGIASQFGLDLGSSTGSDVFSGDNILTLFKSKKMISGVIFKEIPSHETFINFILHEWKWDKKYINNPHYDGCFPFPSSKILLNGIQDSIVNEVCNEIVDKYLTVVRTDKKLSVYVVTTTSYNEKFSFYLTKLLMDETALYYINTKTSLAKNNLNMLQKEADSLKNLLGGTIISNASEVDRTFNLNPALQIQRSSIQKGQLNANVLGIAYGEVVKNLELAKINLQKETPLYQIIDTPTLPLKAERLSGAKVFSITFFLALFFSFLFISLVFNFNKR